MAPYNNFFVDIRACFLLRPISSEEKNKEKIYIVVEMGADGADHWSGTLWP